MPDCNYKSYLHLGRRVRLLLGSSMILSSKSYTHKDRLYKNVRFNASLHILDAVQHDEKRKLIEHFGTGST